MKTDPDEAIRTQKCTEIEIAHGDTEYETTAPPVGIGKHTGAIGGNQPQVVGGSLKLVRAANECDGGLRNELRNFTEGFKQCKTSPSNALTRLAVGLGLERRPTINVSPQIWFPRFLKRNSASCL